jgi:hypothetical protein
MSAYYDSRILRFIEREMLLIYLKKGKVIPYEYVSYKINGKSADPQKVFEKINKGSFINLTSMQMKTDARENRKLFTAELSFGKEKFEISFPARVDLVLGASWENLSNELISALKNAPPPSNLILFTKPKRRPRSSQNNPLIVKDYGRMSLIPLFHRGIQNSIIRRTVLVIHS